MKKLSIIIPSFKDPCLYNTIDSIIESFEGDYEIIPVIDGYKLKEPLRNDSRIKPVILEKNGGMREAINAGVSHATGEYLMRTDEHCMFGKGFDIKMLEPIQDNWIEVSRRYFLNPIEWKVMEDIPPIDYEKMIIKPDPKKLASGRWDSRTKARANIMVDETMAFQGSMWVMPKSWWEKVIVRLDSNGYGTHYQDTIEMLFKTWKAGGKLMLNKNTWYAHKHREWNRSHQYPVEKAIPEWKFSLDLWNDDYLKMRKNWDEKVARGE